MREIKNNRGFTLIELLVVISIIGVLSSVVLTSLAEARGRARDAKWLTEVKSLQTVMTLYKDTNGSYPEVSAPGFTETRSEFISALQPLVDVGYLTEVPVSAKSVDFGELYYFDCSTFGTCEIFPGYTNDEGYIILFTLESLQPNLPTDDVLGYYYVGSPD